MSIYDSNIESSIKNIAKNLKEKISAPDWTKFVKTGQAKERPPSNEDWYYMRAASILRTVAIRGPVGVQKLRQKYGSKKNRGHKPEEFRKAGGKIIRTIFQQLEKAELVKYKKDGVHKGRILTPKGKSFLNKSCIKILKPKQKKEVHKPEVVAQNPEIQKKPEMNKDVQV